MKHETEPNLGKKGNLIRTESEHCSVHFAVHCGINMRGKNGTPCMRGKNGTPCMRGKNETPCMKGKNGTPCMRGKNGTLCRKWIDWNQVLFRNNESGFQPEKRE